MTHEQTMQANPLLRPSIITDPTTGRNVPCYGRLKLLASFPERHVKPEGILETVVSEYQCRMCNHRILLERAVVADETVALGYAVLNDYLPVGPRQMVAKLAGNTKFEETKLNGRDLDRP